MKEYLEMKNEQLVSVLMSIYKESVLLVSQAINSIREQTYQSLEIVVLLDYPEHKEMKEYLRRLAEKEPRLRYYFNERNLGLLNSLNRGVGLCHGDFICRMDADDFSEADRIEKQMQFMEAKGLDLVGSYIKLMNMEGQITGEIRQFPSEHKYVCQYLKYADAVPHPTWLVKKTIYEELNGYRNIPCAEDYDFLVRICLNGFKMGVVREPLLRYRINQKGITQQNIARQKVVSKYLAGQLKREQVYEEREIDDLRQRDKSEENNLVWYYEVGKKWKAGESISFTEICRVLFSTYSLMEIRQRLTCKWILFKDRQSDNY